MPMNGADAIVRPLVQSLQGLRDDFRKFREGVVSQPIEDGQSGQLNYQLTRINVENALTDEIVRFMPSRTIHFTNWPDALNVLQVKFNSPNARPTDVLRTGPVISLDVPIKEMWITTAPALIDSFIEIKVGLLDYGPQHANHINPVISEQRPFLVLNNSSDLVPPAAISGLAFGGRDFHLDATLTSVTVQNMWTAIPAFANMRVSGSIQSLIQSVAGDDALADVVLMDSSATTVLRVLGSYAVPRGAGVPYYFDSGFFQSAVVTVIRVRVNDLGQVGNSFLFPIDLVLHPVTE